MSIGYQKFYDFQIENENNLFIEFVKAEASRPVWHEMFRLTSYGGKRRAARDLGGARVQTGRGRGCWLLEIAVFVLFLTQLRGNVL